MMTTAQYHAHCAFISQRDALIEAARTRPPTHQTVCPCWHGSTIDEGTPLIHSADQQALFDAAYPDTSGEWRWFIIANGGWNICQLRADEYTPKPKISHDTQRTHPLAHHP